MPSIDRVVATELAHAEALARARDEAEARVAAAEAEARNEPDEAELEALRARLAVELADRAAAIAAEHDALAARYDLSDVGELADRVVARVLR